MNSFKSSKTHPLLINKTVIDIVSFRNCEGDIINVELKATSDNNTKVKEQYMLQSLNLFNHILLRYTVVIFKPMQIQNCSSDPQSRVRCQLS